VIEKEKREIKEERGEDFAGGQDFSYEHREEGEKNMSSKYDDSASSSDLFCFSTTPSCQITCSVIDAEKLHRITKG
jgi:hypothetical protein